MANRVACQPDWSWQSDSNGWTGYHIWYVDSGEAYIVVQEEEYHLFPGDVFLFDLRENHICTHHPDNPLQVSTIYFKCPAVLYQTRVVRQTTLLAETVHQIIACMENEKQSSACLWLQALVTSFVDLQPKKTQVSLIVKKACQYLEGHLSDAVSLGMLSQYTGYSQNQLIRLFQREVNCSPMQYYVQKKIAWAKSQLVYSNQSIREISERLGFCDDSYFSKVFKARVGCSPGKFRFQASGDIKKGQKTDGKMHGREKAKTLY